MNALLNRGNAYRAADRLDDALADYTRAIELVPGDPRAHYNRGATHEDREDHGAALADFRVVAGSDADLQLKQRAQKRMARLRE